MAKKGKIHHKHAKKQAPNNALIIGALVIIAIAAFYFSSKSDVAAAVNGEKIYEKRVDALYNSLPSGSKLTKEEILDRLIGTKLLVKYISDNGYSMTEEEFQSQLKARLTSESVDIKDFEENLELRGATMQDVKESFLIELFVNKEVVPEIQVTDSELETFREENKLTFTTEQVRSILLVEKQKQIIAQIIDAQKKSSDVQIYAKYA